MEEPEQEEKPRKRKKRADAGLNYTIRITKGDRDSMARRVKQFQKDPEAFRKWAQEKCLFAVQVLPMFFENPPRGRSSYQAILGAIREFKELMVLMEDSVASEQGRNKKAVRKDSSGS